MLSVVTLAYLWVDHSVDQHGKFSANVVVTSSVIVVALLKILVIFREFMEVRRAPVWLRRLTVLWVLLMATALLGTYFVGTVISE
nr:cytochrome C oxidase subunit IV family protein [Nocardia wallacei]